MDGSAHGTDEGPAREIDEGTAHEYAADADGSEPADAVLFDAIVVRYRSGSDRCTLVPHDGTTEEKLNGWLTADLEAVVELDDVR